MTVERVWSTGSPGQALFHMSRQDILIGSLQELGFLTSGPAAAGFLDWIFAQAKADAIDHILFVSCGFHGLQAMAERRKTAEPQTIPANFRYLPGSQAAFTLAGITEENYAAQLPFLISGAEGLSPFELLERIDVEIPAEHVLSDLGLSKTTRYRADAPKPILDFLQAWKWKVLKVCHRNRRGLLQILIGLGLRPWQRVAFVDLDWDGATQEAFETAIRDLMPLDIFGYHFCLIDSDDSRQRRQRLCMRSLAGPDNVSPRLLAAAYGNRAVAQALLSAPNGPVIGYDPGVDGVAAIENAGRGDAVDRRAAATVVESGMLSFAERFYPAEDALGSCKDPLEMAMPLLEFIAEGKWADHPQLQNIKNFDSWTFSRNRDIWLKDSAVAGDVV
jgi:hypothetical protein